MMYVLQRNFTPIVAPYAALYGIVTYYACLYPYRTVWVMFVIPLQMRHLIGLIVLIHGFHILFQNVYSFCLLTGVFFGFAYFKYEPRFSNYFEKLEEQQEEKDRLSEKQLRKK
jgi:hypothetical protein